jgi:hypothetical protein
VKRQADLTWSAFLASQCNIGRSRAYELISIAEGRATLAEIRERGAARYREHAARKRESPLANGESSEIPQSSQSTNHLGDATPEYARLLNRVIQKLKRLDMEALEEIEQYLTEKHNV